MYLKKKPKGVANRLNVGCEKKRQTKENWDTIRVKAMINGFWLEEG